jgi:hypothetical protein
MIKPMSEYDDLLKKVRAEAEAFRSTAKEYIPKMYYALRREDGNISTEDARDRIEKDCIGIWSKRTMLDAIPDEAKNQKKQEAGRLSQKERNSAAVSAAPYTKKKKLMMDTEGNTIENDTALATALKSTIDDPAIPQFDNDSQLYFEFCIPSKYVLEHLFLAENTFDQICFNVVLDKHTGEVISYSIPDD